MLNLRNIEILLTVMSHFDVTGVKILFYSLVVLRECSYSKLEVPWQLKNVPPNATALECIKCTLGGITSAEPHNFRGLAPIVKAGGLTTIVGGFILPKNKPTHKTGRYIAPTSF